MLARTVTIEGHARNRRDANSLRAAVVSQHPAETLVANDLAFIVTDFLSGIDNAVLQPLMIARRMIMSQEFANRMPQHLLAEEDHHCQPPPLVVAEQHSFLVKFLAQNGVLRPQILDCVLLLSIDPTGQRRSKKLPRMKNHVGNPKAAAS